MTEKTHDLNRGWDSLAAELLYHYAGTSIPEELPFYENRIRENGGKALDQACGAGRHLIQLVKRGLEVHGADASADALEFARQAAEEKGFTPTLFHQTMEECDIPHEYGTIYIPNASFAIVSDFQIALATLARFRDHLTPGGQLLIELFVPEVAQGKAGIGEENAEVWDPEPRRAGEGEIRNTLWVESVDLFEQTINEKRRYELIVGGEVVRSELHELTFRWYYKYEFKMMLESLGFVDIFFYSNNTEEPATKDSKIVTCGARKNRD